MLMQSGQNGNYPYYGQSAPGYSDMNYYNPGVQTDLIFVNGIEGARNFPMSPKSRAILLDSGNKRFFVKSTDNLGLPDITSYVFEEEQNLNSQNSEVAQQPADSVSISRDDYNQIINEINELKKFKEHAEAKLKDIL